MVKKKKKIKIELQVIGNNAYEWVHPDGKRKWEVSANLGEISTTYRVSEFQKLNGSWNLSGKPVTYDLLCDILDMLREQTTPSLL